MTYAEIAGKNLKRFIKEANITQEDFAYEYGTDVRTISRWVNGGIDKTSIVEELAIKLGKSFFDFYVE